VIGITRHPELADRQGLVPCVNCSLASCQFRRAPYKNVDATSADVADVPESQVSVVGVNRIPSAAPQPPVTPKAKHSYAFPEKALTRWARDLLKLSSRGDGGYQARFRLEGSTCSNMGKALSMNLDVGLNSDLVIDSCHCEPTVQDTGCSQMCAALHAPETFLKELSGKAPLKGQPISSVLTWNPPVNPGGCMCSAEHQNHKWRIAYQTILFALEQQQVAVSAKF
jgi:hypothetical protein